jgi:hypothetical protein
MHHSYANTVVTGAKQQNHSHSNTIIAGAQFQNCPVLTASLAEQSKGQVLNSTDWAYLRLVVWGRFVSLCSEILFEQAIVHGREDYCEPETLFRRTQWIIHGKTEYSIHLFFPHQYHSVISLSSDSRPYYFAAYYCTFTCNFLGVPTMLFRNFISLLYWSFTA